MGFWDGLRSSAGRLTNRNAPETPTDANLNSCDSGITAVTKLVDVVRVNGARKIQEYLPEPERREMIGQILTNVGKFAVESAVNESLKGVRGGVQLYKIVQEGLKDQPSSLSTSTQRKPENLASRIEEMQAKMDKIQEEMNDIKQKSKTLAAQAKVTGPPEKAAEHVKESDLLRNDGKRLMIRSRL